MRGLVVTADFVYRLKLSVIVLGVCGISLRAIFTLPNLKTLSSGSYVQIDEDKDEIKRAKRFSKYGLWLLVAGFIVQAFVQITEILVA